MVSKSLKGRVFSEVAPLGHGSLLNDHTHLYNSAEFNQTVEAYIVLNALQKAIEARLSAIKPILHEAVESLGGSNSEISVEGHHVLREKRSSAAPDSDKLKALMESRGLDIAEAFDTVKALVLNPSKLQFLVETGKLAKADVEALCKVTWAIKATPNEELLEACNEALAKDEAISAEKPARKGRKK